MLLPLPLAMVYPVKGISATIEIERPIKSAWRNSMKGGISKSTREFTQEKDLTNVLTAQNLLRQLEIETTTSDDILEKGPTNAPLRGAVAHTTESISLLGMVSPRNTRAWKNQTFWLLSNNRQKKNCQDHLSRFLSISRKMVLRHENMRQKM